jgi:hypothetical protein
MTDKKTYSLVISSQDKMVGSTNNNALYQVNWRDFLPDDVTNYKVNYSFQSTAGSYADGIHKIPTTTAGGTSLLYSTTPSAQVSTPAIAVGTTSFTYTLASGTIYTGQYVVCNDTTMLGTVSCFPPGTFVVANSGGKLYLSHACIYPVVAAPGRIYLLNPPIAAPQLPVLANAVNFNSARIILNTNTKSYSFDTYNKSSSTNLGTITRDIQTTQSRTNSMSGSSSLSRTIVKPYDNTLHIQIFNNAVFAGGITSYSNDVPNTYSIVPTNRNFFTDTDMWGTGIYYKNDMSDYYLYLEFTPLD